MATVLLVEDDNNLREIYQARLMAEGYDIVAAQNGEEALVVAKQNKPDLIISDVMMPRISGFEMLDILRNTEGLKHTPVIMLTALGQSEDQKRADNLGADKYLVKSQVTLEDIVAAAKELLAGDGLGTVHTATPASEPAATPDPAVSAVPAPSPVTPVTASVPVATPPAPIQATTGAIPVAEPPSDLAGSGADAAAPATPPAPLTPPEPVIPASIVPQPDTTVVVPPAPANPTPPTITAVESPVPDPAPLASAPEPAIPPMPVAAVPEPAPVIKPLSEEHLAAASAESAVQTDSAGTTLAPTSGDTSSTEVREEKAEAAVTDAATQTLEAEEAALQAQIASYANEESGLPAAPIAVGTSAVPPPPAPSATSAAADANNAETIKEAVEELEDSAAHEAQTIQPPSIANAPAPPPPPPAPTPPAPPLASAPRPAPVEPLQPKTAPAVSTIESTNDNVNVAGKKVIKPLNDPMSKPDIDVLLAKEAATTPSALPAPIVDGEKIEPPTPGQTFDPNTAL